MSERIVVTGTGIISALGIGREAHLDALRNGRSGLRHPQLLSTAHKEDYVIGEVAVSNDALAENLCIDLQTSPYTRTTMLALTALQQLIAEQPTDLFSGEDLAFINANTVGGMCMVENHYPDFLSEKMEGAFTRYIETLDCAENSEQIIRYFGWNPFVATLSTACSSSGNSMIVGARMLRQGLVKQAICGGCDGLSRFTLNGFLSLKNVSKTPCKPFDQNREGLNLGEGAAYLLLETETDALARGATILAVLDGYANTNDAYHPTAPSPDGGGALLTMQQALNKAGLQPEDIGAVNAHGTATLNNDVSEGLAIEKLFGNNICFASTKAFTGHTLAAAAAVEAVFSIWSLQNGEVYPNLNFDTPMEELSIQPVTSLLQHLPMKHVLSNSFGFGGSNVSLVFSQA